MKKELIRCYDSQIKTNEKSIKKKEVRTYIKSDVFWRNLEDPSSMRWSVYRRLLWRIVLLRTPSQNKKSHRSLLKGNVSL